jgi:hypothetical protein
MNSNSGAGPSNGGSGDGDTPRRTSRKPKCEISFLQSLTLLMLLPLLALLFCYLDIITCERFNPVN